jgi:microsomal dipeptidase-like Zn-dependent dipeptidase
MADHIHVAPTEVTLGGDYWQAGYDIEDDGAAPPVWGMADVHAHPLAHRAFGGRLLWGKPDGPMNEALRWCTEAHGPGGTGLFVSGADPFSIAALGLTENSFGHLVGGHPEFDGWPRFTTKVHQKMYVDWVRRAWQGGLRLMVALVVNNEALAWATDGTDSDDRTAVDIQLAETKALVARHSDFMEIAHSPSEARQIIGQGRLAVVLGVEVDSLGGWGREGDATDDEVRGYLRDLYDRGVRHMFPIHLANNAFGGTAVFGDYFNFLNAFLRREFFDVEGSASAGFRLADAPEWLRSVVVGPLADAYPRYGDIPGQHVNRVGLTECGRYAVTEMMRLGMLVDIDHMSAAAVSDTLMLAEARRYPLVAGHAAFSALADERNEYQRTPEEVDHIRRLGGLVAVGLHQSRMRGTGGSVPNDAPGSSKSWAQAYQWLVERMGGAGVAIGTDINGMAGEAAPRFGLNACHDMSDENSTLDERRAAVDAQRNGVRYDREVVDYRAYRFEGVREGDVYDMERRDVWEAIAIFKSGTDPDQAEMPGLPTRTPWQIGKIRNLAKGFRATSETQLENPFLGGQTFNEQRAAFLVAQGRAPDPAEEQERQRLYRVVQDIWDHWHAMYGDNEPLVRHRAGRRDFDINLDGVAHYGLLPDFLQDLRNVGLSAAQLAPLFRSAEDYIRTWERCERQRDRSPLNAQFVSATAPDTLQRGQRADVTVIMRNTGTTTWTAADSVRLDAARADFGVDAVGVSAPVEPDQEATFTFTITAPGAPGAYELRWQMTRDGGMPFGDVTPSRLLAVLEPPECSGLKAEIAELDVEIADFQADLAEAAPGMKGSIAGRIKALVRQRQTLRESAAELGCSRS